MVESARYLYAISRRLETDALAGITGIRGAPLDTVTHLDLTAVVSDVPLAEFDEVPLKENLERLDWLEQVARAHDGVVQAATMAGPTAPMRLAVICHDDASVRDRLEEWHDQLVSVLDRVEGRAEWSVKVVAPPAVAEPEGGGPPAAGGADYLRRKKQQNDARTAQQDHVRRRGDEVHEQLAARAAASRVLQPQDPQLTGISGTMVLNAAYLVDIDEADRFATLVDELVAAHPDVHIERAGPWPPYSFAVLDPA